MNTEKSKTNDGGPGPVCGWIYYDAACRFCVAGRRRWGRVFERRGYVWVPMQTPGTAARLGVTPERLMREMWVLPADGRPLSGVGAWIELLRRVWWLWPLAFAMPAGLECAGPTGLSVGGRQPVLHFGQERLAARPSCCGAPSLRLFRAAMNPYELTNATHHRP